MCSDFITVFLPYGLSPSCGEERTEMQEHKKRMVGMVALELGHNSALGKLGLSL